MTMNRIEPAVFFAASRNRNNKVVFNTLKSQHSQEPLRFAETKRLSWPKTMMAFIAILAPTTSAILPAYAASQVKTPPAAEAKDRREKVLQWIQNSWNSVKANENAKEKDPKLDNYWNNVRVGLRVTDDTQLKEAHAYRMEILQQGANNAYYPPELVHEALYTAGVYGTLTSDTTVKNELSQVIMPYSEKVMVDTIDEKGVKTRQFVPSAGSNSDEEESVGGGNTHDFRAVAKNALAKIAAPDVLPNLVYSFLMAGNDPGKITPYFSILKETPSSVSLPEVEKKALEWVYSAEQSQNKDEMAALLKKLLERLKDTDAEKPKDGSTPTKPAEGSTPDPSKTDGGLPEELKKPELRSHSGSEMKLLQAQAILFITQRGGDKVALPAIAQYFEKMDIPSKGNSQAATQDLLVLQSLAILAQKNQNAWTILKQVTASQPMLVGQAIFVGSSSMKAGPLRDTGTEVEKAFKAHPKESQALVMELAERKAEVIWTKSKISYNTENMDNVRDIGRQFALVAMALDKRGTYAEYLRKIAGNRFDPARTTAMIGLALGQDKQAIDLLLGIGVNRLEDPAISNLALEAVLKIIAEPDLPPELNDKIYTESPFRMDRAAAFMQTDAKGNTRFNLKANPFHTSISQKYTTWLAHQEKARNEALRKGIVSEAITDEMKIEKFREVFAAEFAGSDEILGVKGNNPEFQEKYLAPMVNYLKTSGPRVQLDLAIPMMQILGKAHYEGAAPVFAEMVVKPEKYAPKLQGGGFFGILIKSMLPAIMKVNALEALGSTANPSSTESHLLHEALKDPFTPYQFASYRGFNGMGKHIQSKLAIVKGTDKETLMSARDTHVQKLMAHLAQNEKGFTGITQNRRFKDILRYEIATTIDGMGGTDALLKLAQAEWAKNPQSPVARSVVHALITNGRTAQEVKERGFNSKMFSSIQNKEYWLENLHQSGATGKGVELGHFDVGYVNPKGALKDLVEYPSWTRFSDKNNWEEPHPTGTVETSRQVAKDAKKIYSYNVSEVRPEDPYQPEVSQDALAIGLEDLIQKQITGVSNVTTTNHSYGFMNFIMYDEEIRTQMIDFFSAYMEALGETGVKNVVSAGNAQGAGPFAVYEPVGSQNTLGSRVDKNGKVTKNTSTVLVAAADGMLRWLAEFSSMPNPLRKEDALKMFCAPGYQEMTLYKDENNAWKLIPVDGTSFSAPNTAGLISVIDQARKQAGLKPWTAEEWEQALNQSSAALPGRSEMESGLYIDVPKLYLNAIKGKK